ncbi:MAG: S8 family serine peptidase, partial [Kiritimatiellae bacterium]|nr:S8 family serine peptidase [Kiritimatiellia bacterium]
MNRLTKLMCALAALAASVLVCGTAHGAPILLKARTIEPEKEAAKLRLMATSATGGKTEQIPERGLYLIQHDGVVTPEWREQLEQCGAIIRSYMPENAYMIEAGPEAYNKIVSGMSYSYFAPFESVWKIHSASEAANSRLTTTTSSSGGGQPARLYYSILIFEETALSDVVAEVEKLTGQVVKKSEGCMIWAMLNAEEVRAVAALPDVHAVSLYVAPRTCNNVAVQASRMNVETVWPNGATGLNLTGAGQVIAVADTGLDTGDQSTVHNDVKGRILSAYSVGRKDFNGKWDDFNGHGTHVVGSVLGNGSESNNKIIRGVAYEASLVMQSTAVDPTDPSAEIWDPYSQKYIRKTLDTGDMYILLNQAYTNQNGKAGARIHSNSWGAPYLGEYSEHDNRLDKFMFDHPDMLVVVAAGNNGIDGNGDGIVDEDSLNTPSSAKNCITVGGTENYRKSGGYADIDFRWGNWIEDDGTVLFPKDPIKSDFSTLDPNGGSIQGMIPWSSRGPCDDGRVKPDIVAPGHQILSLYSSKTKFEDYDRYLNWKRIFYYDDHYCYMQGTSMSCPLVSGSAALVRQWLQESRGVANPDGATIKAVLLAGAKSLCPGQYGAGKYQEIPKDYPNNVEGWGQVNMGNTVGDSDSIQIYDAQVIAYGENAHTVTVNATAGQPLTIIMAYTDAPSSPDSVGGLQNDLDMVVITPSDNELYPNSRTTPDKINNVEGVRLKSGETETGVYTIKVSCARIGNAMSTSLTGGKKNATRYSLVVNGAKEPGQPPDPPAEEKPNLTFVTYTGWPEPAFLSAVKDDPTSVNTFEEGDDIYLWGCYANTGVKESSACKLALELYANDVLADSAERDVRSLKVRSAVGGWQGSRDDLLQGLPAGSYKLCIKLDSGKSIDESKEDDNDIMISFTVAKKAVPIPGAPASLNVSAGGDKLTVSWNAVSGAVKYNVYRSTTSSKPSSPLDTVSAATAYSDGNVAIGTTYYYWVAAVNSEGKEGTAAGPKSGTIDMSLSFDDSSTRQFDAKGGNGSVVVTANANWSATVDKSWVRLGVQNGGAGKTTLRFSVDATGETSDRAATITVSAGGGAAQKTLIVSQKGIQANPALGNALDSTGLSFFTGGDSEWVDVSLDDTFATAGTYVRSGALAYGQTGWVGTIVSGSGTLQFRYGVSGMAAGTFALIVDGSEVATFSTILGQWKYGSYNITSSGSHRIRWEYRQNGNATLSGTSYAMLDDVSFGAVARARPAENVSASSGASGITLNWTLTGGDVSSFNVWRATSLKAAQREKIKTMSASGNGILDQFSCTDGTCQQGITYYYWIESVNASGSAVSEAVSVGLESEYVKFFMPEWKLPAVVGTASYDNTNLEYSANIQFYLKSDVSWISRSDSDRPISANSNWKVYVTVESNVGAEDRHGTLTATDTDGNILCVLPVVQAGLRRNPAPLTWYVDSTKGNDANDGASWESAKKTIQTAIDAALSGDEIIVADGNYIPFAITDKIDMSVRSLNGWDKTVIVNPDAGDDPELPTPGPTVYIYGYSNKITGFTVDGTGYSGNMGGCVRGGTWNRCKITNGNAWRGGGAHTATLISCLVTGNVAEQGGGTFGCELINCTVTGNATKGSSGKGGGTCGGTSQNTIIWGNETTSVDANCSGGTHNYCCTYPLPGSGTGNIDSDPLLMVVDGVCSLGTASPCLNAGRSDYTAGELDLAGNPRIGNGVVDIGAIEDLTVAPASPAASIRAAQTGSITIDIQATSRATEYVVYRSVSSSPRPSQAHATVNATANATTAYIDNDDVLPGVEYWYWIAAKNEAGESAAVLIGKGYRVPSLSLNGSPLQFSSD